MFRHHHLSTAIALAVALALAAASAASARFGPNPVPATPAQSVQAGPLSIVTPGGYGSPVTSNIENSVQAGPRSIVTPGGYGAPVTSNTESRDIRDVWAKGPRVTDELAARDAATGSPAQSPQPAQTVKVFQPSGFDWGDAGIGAGAAFALVLMLLGATLYLTHRRTAHASQPR
jgi:hypothetical protein